MELISVIVPIYNLDAYLYQCISSIASQTYKHLEIMLVDDGSTDNALEICESFKKRDPRIKIIAKANGGLVSARKAGLNASTGEYVFYLDGDDWIDDDCIEQYYQYAKRHDADIVIGDYKREFIGNFVKMGNAVPPSLYDRSRIETEILPRMIYTGEFFHHGIKTYSWGKLYKRKLIEYLQNSVPNEIMVCEDAALLYPAIFNAKSIFISDIAKYNYRQRANSILKSTNFDQKEIGRLARAFNHLSGALNLQDSPSNFLYQLQAYFVAITIIRTGAFLSNHELFKKFALFGAIEEGSRLCLYNSGSFGQHVFKHLTANQHFQFAAWFDSDFRENQLLGMKVDDPQSIQNYDFDYMLVASFDNQIKNEVGCLFEQFNLPKAKIRHISINTSKFDDFIQSVGYDATTFLALPPKQPLVEKANILILGGNPETGAIVEVGNHMGLRTVVIDPYPNSPSKRHAAKSYDIDVTDFNLVNKVIKDEKIEGILVGVADPLVPYYQKLCAMHNFPCYATEKIIHSLTSKAAFAQTCRNYGINTTPNYTVDLENDEAINSMPFPVVVKPVDGGAGVGISVCNNAVELKLGAQHALAISLQKKLIIEKFMTCDDMFAYYTFVNGTAYLSALADRHKTKKQGRSSSVCLAAEYPSKHANRFVDEIHPKLLNMFNGLGIKNGVLLIQFFVDDADFYAYDPGFRLQGEAPHIYLKHFNRFDQREMLLNFALTGVMYQGDFAAVNDYRFHGKLATTIWILLKAGRIGRIAGMEVIKSHANIIQVLQRFDEGSTVADSMLGTERQVFARIFTVATSRQEVAENVKFIFKHLSVTDENDENMVLDVYSPQEVS